MKNLEKLSKRELLELLKSQAQAVEQQMPSKPSKAKKTSKAATKKQANNEPLSIVRYSDKSIAIFGDTKPYKGLLRSFGRFNPFLNTKDGKAPGWIISSKRKTDLVKALTEQGVNFTTD